MNLVRFDPFRELEAMSSRLNRFVGNIALRPEEVESIGAWAPAVDVEETEKEYLIKADLPDIKKTDIKVGIEDGVLTIEGERNQEKEEKGRKFHRVERSYGRFLRRLTVPSDVDQAQVVAEFKEGVLNVHLPKAANGKPRSVDVKVA
jgi:HSP20 family protein